MPRSNHPHGRASGSRLSLGRPQALVRPPGPEALRDYALLADGERGTLVGPRGEVVWMCAPRWDSGAVFAELVGGPGVYAVTPEGRFAPSGYYEEDTLIWRSRWVTEDGIVECRSALAFPGDAHSAVLLRRVTAREGPARLAVVLEPAAGFGEHPLEDARRDRHGVWTGRCGGLQLRWFGGAEARLSGNRVHDSRLDPRHNGERLDLRLSLAPGDHHDFVLELSDAPLPAASDLDADALWRTTEAHWRAAVPRLGRTLAGRDARHAYAVMQGMTTSAGGMVAAATTSLPERAEEGRNYDYRYVWIRDQCYAGQAAAAAGAPALLDSAVRFVTGRLLSDGPHTAPAYTVDGRSVPDQRRLDLAGYPGGYDVVGNRVTRQFQLDVFGEAMLLLATAAGMDRVDQDNRDAALAAADAVARRWHEPDSGIWELRPRKWTHSRLICAAGLRSLAALDGFPPARVRDWTALADAIEADTDRRCRHPDGRWQRSPADTGLDAALLMPPLRGAVAAADPRTVRTLDGFLRELTQEHMAYRFRHDERPLADAEGAFVMCGFVVALALHQQGRENAAVRWFERNRAACGPPGLFAEEFDVTQRALRGNLPQAFVHALLLEAAARLAEPWH